MNPALGGRLDNPPSRVVWNADHHEIELLRTEHRLDVWVACHTEPVLLLTHHRSVGITHGYQLRGIRTE